MKIQIRNLLRFTLIVILLVSATLSVATKSVPYFEFYRHSQNTTYPKVFLASNYEGPPNVDSTDKNFEQINRQRRELIFQKLFSSGFDRQNVILLEEPSPISPQFGESVVEIVKYQPEEVIVYTKADQPKLLFLSDNYYPSWKATVDGKQTKIYRANYSFRAVPLLAGEHSVRFYYESIPFKIAFAVSIISLGLLVILTLGRSPRKG